MTIPTREALQGVIPARMRIAAVVVELSQLAQRRHFHRRAQGRLHLFPRQHRARLESAHQLLCSVLDGPHMSPLGLASLMYTQ